jgi:DNA-binding winged helix-turn-helix (wHTH) protein
MVAERKPKILRFGAFELDLEAEQLTRAGRIVRLQPQPFKLLCLLANRPGQLVTRDEIRGSLWSDDTFVDVDQGVNYAIRQIRDGLGEEAEHPVYIMTVPRRGYRFIAPVIPVVDEAPAPHFESPSQQLSKLMWANIFEMRASEKRRDAETARLKRGLIVAILAAAGAVILAVILLFR